MPGTQFEHLGLVPSLNVPGTHAVHATGHETHGRRAAVRQAVKLTLRWTGMMAVVVFEVMLLDMAS